MKSSISKFATLLLVLSVVVAIRSTGASEEGKSSDSADETSTATMKILVERIELLEKRIAALEQPAAPIRQADSRLTESFDSKDSPTPLTPSGRSEPTQETNGRKWSIRLLGHH